MSTEPYRFLRQGEAARAVIAPSLGGWLLGYGRRCGGRSWQEALFWSPEVVERYPKDMYAGSPILFPLVGKNRVGEREHAFSWADRVQAMPQHGFARRKPWRVVRENPEALEMELTDDEDTRANFPFPFRYRLVYRLEKARLHWEQRVENPGPGPLPFSSGFHPYLHIPLTPEGRRFEARIHLPRCRKVTPLGFWEETMETDQPPREVNVNEPFEGTLFFADLEKREVTVSDPVRRILIRLNWEGAPAYRFLALWTRSPEAPFFCVEPWTALPNSFTTKGDLIILEPGGVFQAGFWLDMEEMGGV